MTAAWNKDLELKRVWPFLVSFIYPLGNYGKCSFWGQYGLRLCVNLNAFKGCDFVCMLKCIFIIALLCISLFVFDVRKFEFCETP